MSQRIKSFILIVLLTSSWLGIFGQNYHFSNLHENLYICNPAYITKTNKIAFLLTYRNQWPGNSDFVTYNGSFFISSDALHSTAGILIMRDVQGAGVITSDYFSLLYGFKTKISRNWQFSGGLQAAYTIYSTNFSGQHFENGQNPGITLDERSTSFDFSTGIDFSYRENASYGFSVSKLGSFLPDQNLHQNLQFNLSYEGSYLLKKRNSNQPVIIEPLFYTAVQKNYNEIMYGARMDYTSIIGGLYARQNSKFQFDAIIILLGTRFGKMAIYYCYDINLSGAESHFTKFAAHEVTFLYDMEYKRKSSKRGAIKCPKI
jgi:type IX secretion system PorP/SprF family membrane protein